MFLATAYKILSLSLNQDTVWILNKPRNRIQLLLPDLPPSYHKFAFAKHFAANLILNKGLHSSWNVIKVKIVNFNSPSYSWFKGSWRFAMVIEKYFFLSFLHQNRMEEQSETWRVSKHPLIRIIRMLCPRDAPWQINAPIVLSLSHPGCHRAIWKSMGGWSAKRDPHTHIHPWSIPD